MTVQMLAGGRGEKRINADQESSHCLSIAVQVLLQHPHPSSFRAGCEAECKPQVPDIQAHTFCATQHRLSKEIALVNVKLEIFKIK